MPLHIAADVLREPMFAMLIGAGIISLLLGDVGEALVLLVFSAMGCISVTDRNVFHAPELGSELAGAIYRLYPVQLRLKDTLSLIGSRPTLDAIAEGQAPRRIAALWQNEIESFKLLRSKYLLY